MEDGDVQEEAEINISPNEHERFSPYDVREEQWITFNVTWKLFWYKVFFGFLLQVAAVDKQM